MNHLSNIVAQSGVELTKAQMVHDQFSDLFDQAAEWEQKAKEIVITDASQVGEMKLAREARLKLRDIRIAADKKKKELKEGILIEGRLIDGIYNVIAGITKPIEDSLLEKEKFVEVQEKKRKAALKLDRLEKLDPYGIDASFYDLENMTDEAFSQLLENTRLAHEAKIEARRKAEEERILREKAEAEERARIAAENARLRKEVEERERELAIERAKVEAERRAAEEKAHKEREQRETAERVERERQQAAIRAAKEAEQKAQYELKMNQEAEERAKQEEQARIEAQRKAKEEAKKRLEAASDKEKLSDYIEKVVSIEVPIVNSSEATGIISLMRNTIQVCVSRVEKL